MASTRWAPSDGAKQIGPVAEEPFMLVWSVLEHGQIAVGQDGSQGGTMKVFSLILTVAITAFPALAGPDETTQALMDDSASMLDLGLLRMNLMLASNSLGSASFDWEQNRITVSEYGPDFATFATKKDKTADDVEIRCANWVRAVRIIAAVNPDDGLAYFGTTSFADMFSHYGFEHGLLKNPSASIDGLIQLRCRHFVAQKPVEITAPLLGKGYSVSKE